MRPAPQEPAFAFRSDRFRDILIVMLQTLALLFAIVAGLAVFIAVFTWWDRKRTRRSFAALREALHGTLRGKTLSGDYRGLPFRIAYRAGGRHSSPSCTVGLETPIPGKLVVRRETQFDRSAKEKEFVVEVQTGDGEFDREFFIDGRDPEYAKVYLGDAGKREATAALLAGTQDAAEVRIGPDGVSLLIQSFAMTRLQPGEMTGILERLFVLVEKVPAAPILPQSGRQPNRFKPLLAVVLCVEAAGTAGAIAGLTRYPPVDAGIVAFSLLFSAPMAAIFLYGSYRALKGGSSSHTLFGILVALSVFAFVPAGVAVAAFINGGEESAPPSVRSVPVVEKRIVAGEDGDVYQLVYDSWRKQGRREEQPVDKALYDRASAGDTLVFTEKKGRFGLLWSAGFQWKPRP